jgi:hypothetical protein
MKLVRYGAAGAEKPGLIDAEGRLRGLTGHIADIDRETLSPSGLAALRELSIEVPASGSGGAASGRAADRDQQTRVRRSQLPRPCRRGRHADSDRTYPLYESDDVHFRTR